MINAILPIFWEIFPMGLLNIPFHFLNKKYIFVYLTYELRWENLN